MSAIASDEETPVNLADLDVPMSEAAPKPDGNFNAAPPPLPELFDERGRAVPYISELRLGPKGIQKKGYEKRDSDGKKTGEQAAYFIADVLAKAVSPEDGRELVMNNFNGLLRPAGGGYTSFTRQGKDMSELAHLGKVSGLDIQGYMSGPVSEMAKDLAKTLAQKGQNAVTARTFLQWQWYSPEQTYTVTKTGETKKGKVVRYGMKNADETLPDGSYSPVIVHKETGETLVAKAVIVKIEPLV